MSARQFYIVLALSTIAMKMQKLPSLVSMELGKDAWLLFVVFGLINVLGILFVFFIFRRIDLKTVLKPSKNLIFNILRFLFMFVTMIYFLVQAILVYEHIQGLFANTLFDDLSWSFFSLLLLFAVFFLAHRGIENIALNFELFTWIIVVALALLAIFGAVQTDYSVILPFDTIDFKNIASKLNIFSCWFGDFFLILYLGVKARDIKLSKTLYVYSAAMIFMTFLVIVFTGIYDKTAAMAPGLISVISEQSLLDISIGRIDWFLILFTEMAAILTCSVHLYFANLCLHSMFPKAKSFYLKFVNIATLYVLDIFILVDLNEKIRFFCGFMGNVSIAVQALTIIVLFGIILFKAVYSRKSKNPDVLQSKPKAEKIKRKSKPNSPAEIGEVKA